MDRGSRSWTVLAGGLSAAAIYIGLTLGVSPAHANQRAETCIVAPTVDGIVAAIIDERTFRLTDGSDVRLAGLEAVLDAGEPAQAEAAASRAKAELEQLVLGRTVAMQILGQDRYGRQLALAVPADERTAPTLQERLISKGLALVGAQSGISGCNLRFLGAERAARASHLGLWASSHYLLWQAERPADVIKARGRFALVQGQVVSVNDRGAIIYVNFGRRWSEDFTVTIAKRNARKFSAAGLEPRTFAGRHIRIRGWIGERGGPWIEAIAPEQIEFVN